MVRLVCDNAADEGNTGLTASLNAMVRTLRCQICAMKPITPSRAGGLKGNRHRRLKGFWDERWDFMRTRLQLHLIHLLVCHLLMRVVGHRVSFLDPAFLRRASS